MVNEDLITYIRAQTKHGASNNDITNILKEEGGWTDKDILDALDIIKSSTISDRHERDTFTKQNKKSITTSFLEEDLHKKNKRRNPFKSLIIFIFVVSFTIGGAFLYRAYSNSNSKKPVEENKNVEEVLENQNIVNNQYGLIERDGKYYIQGELVLPEGVSKKPVGIINTIASSDLFPVEEDGSFEIEVVPDEINIIAAMLPDKEFGLIKIMLPSDFKNGMPATVNTQSSAVALVFLSPFLKTEDLNKAESILYVARGSRVVADFSKVLASKVVSSGNPLEDDDYIKSFGNAVESVLEYLNQPETKDVKG